MKRWLALLLLSLQLLFGTTFGAEAAVPPKPTTGSIYVQDYANLLSSQTRSSIDALGRELDAKTGAQVVVVTVSALDGQPLEDYSLQLFRSWGLGNKEKNNGVLLLIASNDRQSRIEVGYGLEGALPDGLTGRIQDQAMLPYFRAGNFDRGILQGYGNVVSIVAREYKVELSGSPAAPKGQEAPELPIWQKLLLFVGLAGLLLLDQLFLGGAILRFLILILMRGGGRGGGGFGGGYGGGSGGGGGSSRRW